MGDLFKQTSQLYQFILRAAALREWDKRYLLTTRFLGTIRGYRLDTLKPNEERSVNKSSLYSTLEKIRSINGEVDKGDHPW